MSRPSIRKFKQAGANGIGVRGYLHTPKKPTGDGIVLTHGAGQNCESPLLVALATAFCEAGVTVLRCDLPFRQVRPGGPPGWPGCAESDRQGLRRAIEALRKIASGRIVLSGHSYGGRQSSMLAAEEPGLVEAILVLGYPLKPPKRPQAPRTTHFATLKTPALFVHGTRDGFGSIEEMTAAIKRIPARTRLLAIESAGHELLTKKNERDLPKQIVEAFAGFRGAGAPTKVSKNSKSRERE
jgi:predicted alpha/beta-hydrolase family hydrolase